jgi:hypothetical protein
MLVGLNPAVLVHVVGGAHNEALLMLVVMAGVYAFVCGRRPLGTAVATAAAGIKASAALVAPFLFLGTRPGERRRALLASAGVVLAIGLLALIGFGTHALDALGLLSSNQGRTSRWSLPYKTAQLLGAILPGDRLDYRSAVRAVYAVAFAAVAARALWLTWRGADPIRMAAWTTLAVLLASAWLVPWYLLWLLPLAALAADRRLLACSVALTAWTLVVAVPL